VLASDLAELERLVDRLQAGRVISIAAVRRASDVARRLRSERGARRQLALLEALTLVEIQREGEDLLDIIEYVVAERPGAPTAVLAKLAARDPRFRRRSRAIRRWAWGFMDLPTVTVRAHQRKGRPVRRHGRVVGLQHLAGIAASAREPRVGEVLHAIIARQHYRRARTP